MKNSPRRERRQWRLDIFLLSLIAIVIMGLSLFALEETGASSLQWLPVSLRSKLTADYGIELFPTRPIALQWKLVEDSIRDDKSRNADVPARVATLANQMQTPVPEVAPTPTVLLRFLPIPTELLQAGPLVPSNQQPTDPQNPAPTATLFPIYTIAPTPAPPPIATPRPPDRATKEPKPTVTNPTKEPKPTIANPTKDPKPNDPQSIKGN